MRAAFAHDALVDMDGDADLAALGGAVTLVLCGAFEHPPPCPVAAHHTRADGRTDGMAVRVLFATEAACEADVRARIDQALAAGCCEAPDGTRTRWTFRSSTPGTVTELERAHADRLIGS